VIVTSNALPAVGAEVAGPTEKNLGPVPLVGVGVAVVGVAVAVEVVAASATVMLAEVPDTPEELSVTSSVVVSGSTRVRLAVAKPLANTRLLPAAQAPAGG
jgi:hypothetical protein